jgi:hypothetical protein
MLASGVVRLTLKVEWLHGRVVGAVMSALVVGILASRTFYELVAEWLGCVL